MQVTFYSVMMSLFCTTIAIIVLFFMRRNVATASTFNVRTILLLYFLCVVRMCIPFEFKFTRVINTPLLYNWICPIFGETIAGHSVEPLRLILLVCLVVSAVLLIRLLCKYLHTHRLLKKLLSIQDKNVTENIKNKFPEFYMVKNIIVNPMFKTPMQSGFFQPTILLPTLDYEDRDLYYIIKHELVHYYNRDTWMKLFINIWKCVFWWFPFTWLLCHELDDSLELKCDSTLIQKMTPTQKSEYLTALLHAYEKQTEALKENKDFQPQFAAFYKSEEALLHRFRHIQTYRSVNCSPFIFAFFCALFLSSYIFIFQAYGSPTYPVGDEWVYFSDENAYLVQNDEGSYELYINHKFSCIVEKDTASRMIQDGIILQNVR